MSPVFDCSDEAGRLDGISKAATAVRAGDLVVLPTDTLYGIGCDAFSPSSVQRLLDAKGRGREMPPPVLVPTARTVDGLATDVPEYARVLMEKYWPGALTIILLAQQSLAWDLGETNGTVAVRMPDQELALELLREVGPMAVSSANRSGQPAARNLIDAATQLGASVEVYLDGGPVKTGLPSTIVDCTGDRPVVVRRGALSEDDIMATVAEVLAQAEATAAEDTEAVEDADTHTETAEAQTEATDPDTTTDGDPSADSGEATR